MTFDKEAYWKRRNNTVKQEVDDGNGGKTEVEVRKPLRGQGDSPKPVVVPDLESGAQISFDNSGNMVQKNREYRRRRVRVPGDNAATKKTLTKDERKKLRKKGRK